MLLTCPIGQNRYLDEYIQDGADRLPRAPLPPSGSAATTEWREVELSDVKGARYHSPYRNANAVFVGIVPPLISRRQAPADHVGVDVSRLVARARPMSYDSTSGAASSRQRPGARRSVNSAVDLLGQIRRVAHLEQQAARSVAGHLSEDRACR